MNMTEYAIIKAAASGGLIFVDKRTKPILIKMMEELPCLAVILHPNYAASQLLRLKFVCTIGRKEEHEIFADDVERMKV